MVASDSFFSELLLIATRMSYVVMEWYGRWQTVSLAWPHLLQNFYSLQKFFILADILKLVTIAISEQFTQSFHSLVKAP
jgi:hypothetical protein